MKFFFTILVFCCAIGYSQSWQNIGPFYGLTQKGDSLHSVGLVKSFAQHPVNSNTYLMGSNSSGVWKTTNNGKDWINTTSTQYFIPGMGAEAMAVNPQNSEEVLCGVSNNIYGDDSYTAKILKSTDFGSTWKELTSFKNPDWQAVFVRLQYLDGSTILAATTTRVMLSKNGGESWETIFYLNKKYKYVEHEAQTIVDFTAFDTQNIIITSQKKWNASGQVWRTNNGGKNWDNIGRNILSRFSVQKIVAAKVSHHHTSKAIVAITDFKKIQIYETLNKGETFEYKGEFKTTYQTGDAKGSKFQVVYSQNDTTKLYFGFIEFFEWTPKKGLKILSPTGNISAQEHDDVRVMEVFTNKQGEEYLIMGNDGGLSLYFPESHTFKSLNGLYLPTVQIYNMGISQVDNPNILIGTQDNGTFEFIASENKWFWVGGGDGGASWLSVKGNKQFSCANASVIFKTEGKRGARYYSPNKHRSGWFLDFPVEMGKNEETIIMGSRKKGSAKGATLYLHNTQNSREQSAIEIEKVGKIGEIEICEEDENLLYIASGDYTSNETNTPRLLKSTNAGKSFTDLSSSVIYVNDSVSITLNNFLSYRTISDIEIDPHDKNKIYISITGYLEPKSWTKEWEYYRVLCSYNGGETWEDYSKGLPTIPVHELIRHKGAKSLLYCGTDDGVYVKKNFSSKWELLDNNFPKNVTVSDLKINYCNNTLYAATYGRSVLALPIQDDFKVYTKQHKKSGEIALNEKAIIPYDIRIGKKQTVTIKQDILLSRGAKIILAPKSKLIIDGATVSRRCTEDLPIIELEKKKFLFFFKRRKGKVEVINNGKIIE